VAHGFLSRLREARPVDHSPVIDRIIQPIPLDPLSAIVAIAVFVACALATMRRPSYGLAALLFVQPFALYREIFATQITLPKIVLLATILGLVSYRGLWAKLREPPIRNLALALASVLVATFITIFVAQHHDVVIRETLKDFEYLLMALAAYAAYRLDPDDSIALGAFTLSVALVVITALAEEFTGAPSGMYMNNGHIVPRIAGALEGPNQLAGYLEVAVAVLGAWVAMRPSRISAIVLGAVGCALILTFSRSGYFGSAVALVVIAAVLPKSSISVLKSLAGGALAGLIGAFFWALQTHSADVFRITATSSAYAGGVGNRGDLWRAAWFFFRQHPLLGIGAGNFELELADAGLYGVRTHANSWYFQSLAEGGIVLFAAVCAFIATAIVTLWRGIRQSPWTLGGFAATIALALHQVLDYLVFYPKVGGPWIIAIALGAAAMATRDRTCD
jgi:O-antigen ligase